MNDMTERPIDALDHAKGKKVFVKLKNGDEITLYNEGEVLEIIFDHKISTIDLKSDTLQLIKPLLESPEILKTAILTLITLL